LHIFTIKRNEEWKKTGQGSARVISDAVINNGGGKERKKAVRDRNDDLGPGSYRICGCSGSKRGEKMRKNEKHRQGGECTSESGKRGLQEEEGNPCTGGYPKKSLHEGKVYLKKRERKMRRGAREAAKICQAGPDEIRNRKHSKSVPPPSKNRRKEPLGKS